MVLFLIITSAWLKLYSQNHMNKDHAEDTKLIVQHWTSIPVIWNITQTSYYHLNREAGKSPFFLSLAQCGMSYHHYYTQNCPCLLLFKISRSNELGTIWLGQTGWIFWCNLRHVMCMLQLPGCANNAIIKNKKELKDTYTPPQPILGREFWLVL